MSVSLIEILLSVFLILFTIFAVLCLFDDKPNYIFGFIHICFGVCCLIGIGKINADKKDVEYKETVIGNYGNPYLVDIDTINIKITAVMMDNQVTRTAEVILRGKDFTNDDLDVTTNNALKNMVVNMINNRKRELDSLQVLYSNDAIDPKNCDIRRDDSGKLYKICQLNE